MGSPGKAPHFDGTDYDYWKVHMRTYQQSLGSKVWEVCQNPDYVVLDQHTTPAQKEQHEANSKALNAVIA